MFRIATLVTLTSQLVMSGLASAEVVRFQALTPSQLEAIIEGRSDTTVEFRKDDPLPLDLLAAGDLFVTNVPQTTTLRVAQTFYVRVDGEDILLSRDGVAFLPFKEAITGHLKASATSGSAGRVDHVTLDLMARFRN